MLPIESQWEPWRAMDRARRSASASAVARVILRRAVPKGSLSRQGSSLRLLRHCGTPFSRGVAETRRTAQSRRGLRIPLEMSAGWRVTASENKTSKEKQRKKEEQTHRV